MYLTFTTNDASDLQIKQALAYLCECDLTGGTTTVSIAADIMTMYSVYGTDGFTNTLLWDEDRWIDYEPWAGSKEPT